jgi:ATP phosphoribosyltransferase regulatory subunit
MPRKDGWLLPAGIEEILPPQAARLERSRREILDLFYAWGYDLVIPPLIEYLDSLLTGTGSDLDLRTFKLTDQLTGRLMGIRADMTPQVARIDAHHLRREGPVRLCYLGTVLHTRPDGFAGSRSPLQVGAELYGHGGIESDVEILGLMLETLAIAGVREVHVDVNDVGIFRTLAEQAQLNPECEALLFDALQRKAIADIESLLAEYKVAPSQRSMLAALAELNGGEGVLDQARPALEQGGPNVQSLLDRLRAFADLMREQTANVRVHFDLAELRGYHYQTGVVFAAFVPGHGQEIARGGRYDDIGKVFGRARPATGFSADLKTLLAVGDGGGKPALEPAPGIYAPCSSDPALRESVERLRQRGERVIYALPGQTTSATEVHCDRVLVEDGGRWVVIPHDALPGPGGRTRPNPRPMA